MNARSGRRTVAFAVVKNDTLAEVVRSVADELHASADGLAVADGLFVHMQDPVI